MDAAKLMRDIVEAFGNADLAPLFAAIDDKIVWKSASAVPGLFRFEGAYADRVGAVEVTSRIATAYTFHRVRAIEVVASGDTVWGLFEFEGDYRLPGSHEAARPIRLEIAIRWLLKNGKIVEHRAFFDTADLLRQQGDPLPKGTGGGR